VLSLVLTETIILYLKALNLYNLTKYRNYPTSRRLTRIFKRKTLEDD
tara:strand:- start:27918 stop:28058 length:141 start_codon:yes stop_codon:yes gene_type:complete